MFSSSSSFFVFCNVLTDLREDVLLKMKHSTYFKDIQYKKRTQCKLRLNFFHWARCLKITKKVSFNIANEASYVYILKRQKIIKKLQKTSIENYSLRPNSVNRLVTVLGQNWCKMPKLKHSNETFWMIFKSCETEF